MASTTSQIPNWLEQSYFEEILRENVAKFSKIKSFSGKSALGPGENYASQILRIKIEVELTDNSTKSLSYMIKVPNEFVNTQQLFMAEVIANNENDAYLNVLPKFIEMYKAKGLDVTLAPTAYKFKESLTKEPKLGSTVLMYDLGQDDYKNLNRLECLNFEQTKYALRKLAQYHAAGAHYLKVNGSYSSLMTDGLFGKEESSFMAVYDSVATPFQKRFLSNLKNYKNGDKYYTKFVNVYAEMRKQYPIFNRPDPADFNVLNHGDCWINNLLFKLGPKDEIIDMVFVDFQLPKVGHPAKDVYHLIFTSAHIDHKLKDFDYFIYYYHSQLTEHLRILGYKEHIPTLKEFHIQLYKYGMFAISASIIALPVVLLAPNEGATMENLLGENEAGERLKNLMYTNKRYQNYIEQILPWLENRGLLDA